MKKCNLKKSHKETKNDSLKMCQELRELRISYDLLVTNLSAHLKDQVAVKNFPEDKLPEGIIIEKTVNHRGKYQGP